MISLEEIQAGKWYFAFLNDNTKPLEIKLTPTVIPRHNHETTNHGCRFDCFGKGNCVRNRCVCYPGFSGRFCEETLCPVLCSNNGVFSNGRCVCHENYRGAVCDETVNTCPNGRCESIESQVPEALNANRAITDPLPSLITPSTTVETQPLIVTSNNDKRIECAKECEHGYCLNGTCICDSGWNGEDCSMSKSLFLLTHLLTFLLL